MAKLTGNWLYSGQPLLPRRRATHFAMLKGVKIALTDSSTWRAFVILPRLFPQEFLHRISIGVASKLLVVRLTQTWLFSYRDWRGYGRYRNIGLGCRLRVDYFQVWNDIDKGSTKTFHNVSWKERVWEPGFDEDENNLKGINIEKIQSTIRRCMNLLAGKDWLGSDTQRRTMTSPSTHIFVEPLWAASGELQGPDCSSPNRDESSITFKMARLSHTSQAIKEDSNRVGKQVIQAWGHELLVASKEGSMAWVYIEISMAQLLRWPHKGVDYFSLVFRFLSKRLDLSP